MEGSGDAAADERGLAESEERGEEANERDEGVDDFENFDARDMAAMSRDEWEAAFDADSWVTGGRLLDRVETDLRRRVEERDVFAALRRERRDDEERLVAYSDEGYAVVYEDGSVEGRGTVLRDVKPTVALASMPEYEVLEPTGSGELPAPEAVTAGSGDLGNVLLQAVAGVHLLAGVALLVAWVVLAGNVVLAVAGVGFLLVGGLLGVLVANARLSDRFRSAEYRDRLRAVRSDGDGREEPRDDGDRR